MHRLRCLAQDAAGDPVDYIIPRSRRLSIAALRRSRFRRRSSSGEGKSEGPKASGVGWMLVTPKPMRRTEPIVSRSKSSRAFSRKEMSSRAGASNEVCRVIVLKA